MGGIARNLLFDVKKTGFLRHLNERQETDDDARLQRLEQIVLKVIELPQLEFCARISL